MVLGAILQPPPGGAPLGGIFWLRLLPPGSLRLAASGRPGRAPTSHRAPAAIPANDRTQTSRSSHRAQRTERMAPSIGRMPRRAVPPPDPDRASRLRPAWDARRRDAGLEAAIADDRRSGWASRPRQRPRPTRVAASWCCADRRRPRRRGRRVLMRPRGR
jgi:hypothetical protein